MAGEVFGGTGGSTTLGFASAVDDLAGIVSAGLMTGSALFVAFVGGATAVTGGGLAGGAGDVVCLEEDARRPVVRPSQRFAPRIVAGNALQVSERAITIAPRQLKLRQTKQGIFSLRCKRVIHHYVLVITLGICRIGSE